MITYRAEQDGISRYIQAHHIPKYAAMGYSIFKIEDDVEMEVADTQSEFSNAEPMDHYFKPGGENES